MTGGVLRQARLGALCALVAIAASGAASVLGWLIAGVTRLSWGTPDPAQNQRGLLGLVIPVVGGLAVGLMSRWAPAIRGHGIPEAMEQVLTNGSRIHWRMAVLKPLSAAIAIGTGGPFGAEGPIIATGGALGSLLGQRVSTTPFERRVLLASGAAAGMAATFGTPLAAVLLAVELLLFEFRARSIVPVAFAATVATAIRFATVGSGPMFEVSLHAPTGTAIALYTVLGAGMGLVAVGIVRVLHAVERAFERLRAPHLTPALGAVAVGLVGLVAPRTLGVGYGNIQAALSSSLTAQAALALCGWKLASWVVSLGSGTSGGTLAPLLTAGGALGLACGAALGALVPGAYLDLPLAALVGMAALFAGASHATLTSLVFAVEITDDPHAILPLVAAVAAATFVSRLLMRHSIMTAKIAQRGIPLPRHG